MKKILIFSLVLVLCMLVAGGAVYYFSSQPETITSPLQVPPTIRPVTPTVSLLSLDTQEVKQLVDQFYAAYTTCLKNPPANAKGKVTSYCQNGTGVTTNDFTTNLKANGIAVAGADPLFCAQTKPSSISADTVDFEAPDRGVVTAVAVYGSGFAQKIPVVVTKEEEKWKVATITCPK